MAGHERCCGQVKPHANCGIRGGAKPFDYASAIFAAEAGELSETELIVLVQFLVSTGLAWQLQGSWQRTCCDLIVAGLVTDEGLGGMDMPSERRREELVRQALKAEGYKLVSRWGSQGREFKRFQIVSADGHWLIAGDSIYGWDLDRIEQWVWPDMCRCPEPI